MYHIFILTQKFPHPICFSPTFPCTIIFSFKKSISGDEGYRSPCPSHAKRMLYHLSYIPLLSFFFLFFTSSFSLLLLFLFPFEKMHPVGFEPTHLSIAVLETAPLDHSGTNAFYPLLLCFLDLPVSFYSCSFHLFFSQKCIRWGSNPRIFR